MKAIEIRLEQFKEEFLRIFAEAMNNWDGHLDVFYPADNIVKQIFKPI